MSERKIELQAGTDGWRSVVTFNPTIDEIELHIDIANKRLADVRDKLAASVADNYSMFGGGTMPIHVLYSATYMKENADIVKMAMECGTGTIFMSNWAKNGNSSWRSAYAPKKVVRESVPEFIGYIDELRQNNAKFLLQAKHGKLTSKSTYFMASEPIRDWSQDGSDSSWPAIELTAYRVPFQSECTHCRTVVNTKQLPSHMKTARCINYRMYNVIHSGDNERVDYRSNKELYNLCHDGLIDTELVAYKYDAYVPKWIYSAYQVWNKNGGFAGLSLYDYLQKMRPESDNSRAPTVNVHMYRRKRDPR
jgi:hypothetical protein